MTSKLDHALALARDGFRVFPLAINGKAPVHSANWRKSATRDEQRIRAMWSEPMTGADMDYNIGIALDQTTIVVDVDVRDGKRGRQSLRLLSMLDHELTPTWTVDTATGGEHHYYRIAHGETAFPGKLADDIDIKQFGGFAVGPGSTINGQSYRAHAGGFRANEIQPAPDWIRAYAVEQRRDRRNDMDARTAIVELDSESAIARATDWLTNAAPDHGTYAVAARVKDFGVSESACVGLMLEHWRDRLNLPKDDPHIEFRVANAYRYGQNAPGVLSAEAEFEDMTGEVEARTAGKPAAERRRGLYFVPWSAARPDLDQPYLIDDVMELGKMVVTYGDSNTGKSFVALDQGFHIASGRDWCGHKVKQGLVVYVAAEGGLGFAKRIEAYKRHHKVEELPFALAPCPIDLFSENADTGRLVKLVKEAEGHFGQSCALIVIDTLARAMGGGDENTTVDMSRFVGHVDRLRIACKATVNIVHHTGKDKSKGARGSSALRAATDSEMEVEVGRLHVKKQRDMEVVGVKGFGLRRVEIGRRADGKAVSSCVVEWRPATEFTVELKGADLEMYTAFDTLMKRAEADKPDNDDPAFVDWEAWKKASFKCVSTRKGDPATIARVANIRGRLLTKRVIQNLQGDQWVRGDVVVTHTHSQT